ncbi:MAG: hypothetical protein ACR2OG_04990 [Gemmatimonadaceae bacterium]
MCLSLQRGLVLITTVLAACGKSGSMSPPDITGVYALRTADGLPVPASVSVSDVAVTYERGTIRLTASDSIYLSITTSQSGRAFTSNEKGTFQRSGAFLIATLSDSMGSGEVATLFISGSTISMGKPADVVFIFTK